MIILIRIFFTLLGYLLLYFIIKAAVRRGAVDAHREIYQRFYMEKNLDEEE